MLIGDVETEIGDVDGVDGAAHRDPSADDDGDHGEKAADHPGEASSADATVSLVEVLAGRHGHSFQSLGWYF
ncbi:hypothetical protein GCM10017596_16200 [Microbacterium keratanolyticum]|uniref:Uncharacterized protein n=1 Tax=Microbacterium keratanolyticum TaxID=67574 RepID=A0A9W6HTW8_9MICO|nr:hypothetical protein GCM10017596_16200 [Microbacterium keratanolyticum]